MTALRLVRAAPAADAPAARRAQAAADRAWVHLHTQLVTDGVAGAAHVREQIARYEALAVAHPTLVDACVRQIRRLIAAQEAQEETEPHG